VEAAEDVHAEQRSVQVRQGDHAQPIGAHAALQRQVGTDDAPGDPAAGSRRTNRLVAVETSRSARAAGIATPLAPVSTRKSTLSPFSVPGQ